MAMNDTPSDCVFSGRCLCLFLPKDGSIWLVITFDSPARPPCTTSVSSICRIFGANLKSCIGILSFGPSVVFDIDVSSIGDIFPVGPALIHETPAETALVLKRLFGLSSGGKSEISVESSVGICASSDKVASFSGSISFRESRNSHSGSGSFRDDRMKDTPSDCAFRRRRLSFRSSFSDELVWSANGLDGPEPSPFTTPVSSMYRIFAISEELDRRLRRSISEISSVPTMFNGWSNWPGLSVSSSFGAESGFSEDGPCAVGPVLVEGTSVGSVENFDDPESSPFSASVTSMCGIISTSGGLGRLIRRSMSETSFVPTMSNDWSK
mmetsp:Transcript_33528/g.70504  ORF Transcript_33528/g.70504 Transcript_33528/m.70504 type:complete len:324 (-) Transcript_33528:826-1797(-)